MTAPSRMAHRDGGFTLVELLIAIVLSGIIGGVTVATMATSLNIASSTSSEVHDSVDSGLISAFLFRDAQAVGSSAVAGGNASLGVVTAASSASAGSTAAADWAGCVQPGTFVVRFGWLDAAGSDPQTVVATYALDADHQLVRQQCSTTTSSAVLGRSVASVAATCDPDVLCASSSGSVALHVVGAGDRVPFDYTLRASLRVDAPNRASSANSPRVPLVALGDRGSTRPCPNLTVVAAARIVVVGSAVIGADCGAHPIAGDPADLHATGTVTTQRGIGDPFATVEPPAEPCSGGANPSPIGDDPSGGDVVYPSPVTITGTVAFQPGTYVFCNGLTIGVGATVVGTDVVLVVAGGTFAVDARASVHLDAPAAGAHANLLVWVTTAQDVEISTGDASGALGGYVYAPTSQVHLTGDGSVAVGGIVAQGVDLADTGSTRLGLPIPAVTITPFTLADAQAGVAYSSASPDVTGGAGPWRWTAKGLPAGMTIDPATGALGGTPQSSATSTISYTVTDASLAPASVTATLVVRPAITVTGPATLPTGEVGVQYPATVMTASGGSAPVTWSASGLPAGLAIDPPTGTISGTPTAAGSFPVTVTVTDSSGATASRVADVDIASGLAITTAGLPRGQVGVAFPANTMQSSGGSAPLTWSASGLPPGLTIDPSTGAIAGTPSAAGSYATVVHLADGRGGSVSAAYVLDVDPPLAVGTSALPTGEATVAYPSTTLTTSGGTAPFTWSATGLPAGLALDATSGQISGMPTTAGTSSVHITVTDATGAVATSTSSLVVAARLAITGPATLPTGQVGQAYPATTISTSGGSGALSWSATGLPAGLAIDATTGVISGTPTAGGTASVTITVSDALTATASATRSLTVNAALVVTTSSLTATQLGAAYSATLAASGGSPAYTWSATGLPAGLTINAAGTIAGTPSASGTFTVVAKVRDSGSVVATRSLTLDVSSVPYGCPANPSGWRAQYYANASLSGTQVACQDDAAINFDWGSGSPGAGLPADNFSVRWTRTQTFAAGSYVFTMGSDDGSRLYIDGAIAFDQWSDHGYPSPVPTVTKTLTAGDHLIVMEYYERGGNASATLSWAVDAPVTCPTSPSGWVGQYYANGTLTGTPALCRDDATINFDWGAGSPGPTLPSDGFSARWTRTKTFTAGTYTFALGTDDGGRLYVDGTLVLDKWQDQGYPSTVPTVSRTLTAGAHTLVVEYYEHGGNARATFTQTP